jgi:HEAT repeat protein
MTDTNEEVRVNAISALCKIQTDPAHVVPALITYLSDPAPIVRRNTILALSQFGAKAKPAVPALLQLLRDEKYDPARSPDPVAATKGRLNQPK